MSNGRISLKKILLNLALVLLAGSLALLWSVRHAYWGPEGPVGGWLLLVPYLVVVAADGHHCNARSWGSGGMAPSGSLAK